MKIEITFKGINAEAETMLRDMATKAAALADQVKAKSVADDAYMTALQGIADVLGNCAESVTEDATVSAAKAKKEADEKAAKDAAAKAEKDKADAAEKVRLDAEQKAKDEAAAAEKAKTEKAAKAGKEKAAIENCKSVFDFHPRING